MVSSDLDQCASIGTRISVPNGWVQGATAMGAPDSQSPEAMRIDQPSPVERGQERISTSRPARLNTPMRSEERPVGKECVSTCRSRRATTHKKNNRNQAIN